MSKEPTSRRTDCLYQALRYVNMANSRLGRGTAKNGYRQAMLKMAKALQQEAADLCK